MLILMKLSDCLQHLANWKNGCAVAKSDVQSTFRILGLEPGSWPWLVMWAKSPLDNKWYYFVDKCLPFGSSISCALFQKVSDALTFIVQVRIQMQITNYLDDYLFVATVRSACNQQVTMFLQVCKKLNIPIAQGKTEWASEIITFLGFLLDTINQVVLIPLEKIAKGNDLIDEALNAPKNKITVLRLQQICGFLNFLWRCVVPGHVFMRRLYSGVSAKLKPHYHIRLTAEMRLDLKLWKTFLAHPSVFCRPFADFAATAIIWDTRIYTDSSKNPHLGCGGVHVNQWFALGWDPVFVKEMDPSIEYLELYVLVVGVHLWISQYANSHILIHCDNQAVVAMVNNTTSSCKHCMILLRLMVLQSLILNVKISARYVRSSLNQRSDALSRKKFDLFWRLSSSRTEKLPLKIPHHLWPMSKVW